MNARLKLLLASASLAAGVAVVWTVASLGASAVRADEPLFPNAKVGVRQALLAAEAQGGTAESAAFVTDGGGRWSVVMAPGAGGEPVTYLVDPNSGAVTGRADQRPLAAVAEVAQAAVAAPASAAPAEKPAHSLADSITLAEKQVHGAAIDARIDRNGGASVHLIGLATGDGRKDVRVDAAGHVTVE